MKTDIEVIDGAIALIEGDGKWCQGAFCKTVDGTPLIFEHGGGEGWMDLLGKVRDLIPASFCLEGAIRKAAGHWWHRSVEARAQMERLENMLVDLLLKDRNQLHANTYLHVFNDDDTTTQEDAILLLKRGRTLLEERQ